MVEVKCGNCEKIFFNYASNYRKFCSRTCSGLGKWKEPAYRAHMVEVHKGLPQTQESRLKRSKQMTGNKHPQWQGGKTNEDRRLRGTGKYKDWRRAVFERDNFTCQDCGVRGVYLHADHIKQFAHYPELRFELSNGRSLCVPCHKKTDTYLWKGLKAVTK